MIANTLYLKKPLRMKGKIDSAMEEIMDNHFLEQGNKLEYKIRSRKDEAMKVKLKFFIDCLNMNMVSTYVSKKVVGCLLHMEAGGEIYWATMISTKIIA